MDSFESQLRFGMTLSNLTHNESDTTLHGNRFLKTLIDRVQNETKKKSTSQRTTTAVPVNGKTFILLQTHRVSFAEKPVNHRLEFLTYSLSLMRSIHEHGDQEPSLDVLSYKHLSYLLDGFMYYFRENGTNEVLSASKPPTQWREITDDHPDTTSE